MKPRELSPEERVQVSEHFFAQKPFADQYASAAEVADYLVDCCCVAVFDNYITDGPGYAGKVISIVWSGCPSIVSTLTFRDGAIDELTGEIGASG